MKNKGIIFILSGLLLIAAAFFLTGYNIYDENNFIGIGIIKNNLLKRDLII